MDTVLHFPPSLEEVSLSVSGDRLWLRNHVEDHAGDDVSSFSVIFCSVKYLRKNHFFCDRGHRGFPTANTFQLHPPSQITCYRLKPRLIIYFELPQSLTWLFIFLNPPFSSCKSLCGYFLGYGPHYHLIIQAPS